MDYFVFIINGVKLLDFGNFGIQFLILVTQFIVAGCAIYAIKNGRKIYRKQKEEDRKEYKKQKEIDRLHAKQDEVTDELILLKFKIQQIIYDVQRVFYFSEKRIKKDKDFFENIKKVRINILGILSEETIPVLGKSKILFEIHFSENIKIANKLEKLEEKMRSWGKFMQNFLLTEDFHEKDIASFKEADPSDIEILIKDSIDEIKKARELK